MGKLAARHPDPCSCVSHGMTSAGPPLGTTVTMNGLQPQRLGEYRQCPEGGSNYFNQAAATVTIHGHHAVRVGDATVHGGAHWAGSPNIIIGGPTLVGNLGFWNAVCAAMNATRTNAGHLAAGNWGARAESHFQSLTNNCGCEATRQLVWAYGRGKPTEGEYIDTAGQHGGLVGAPTGHPEPAGTQAHGPRAKAWDSMTCGGDANRQNVLEKGYNLKSDSEPVSAGRIERELYAGRPVIVPVLREGGRQKHLVVATAMEIAPDGSILAYYVNDTAFEGGCGVRTPAGEFRRQLRTEGDRLTVMKGPPPSFERSEVSAPKEGAR